MGATPDTKRELLRHAVAALAYRAGVALSDSPGGFAALRVGETTRTPAEILAHMGDLLEGSLLLLRGEFVYLKSEPLPWAEEVARFYSAVKAFDSYLASDAPLAHPVEKILQGPVADALTHVGQIVLLRRLAGAPVRAESYFTADIVAGEFDPESFGPAA